MYLLCTHKPAAVCVRHMVYCCCCIRVCLFVALVLRFALCFVRRQCELKAAAKTGEKKPGKNCCQLFFFGMNFVKGHTVKEGGRWGDKKCITMLQRQPSFNYVKYFCVQRARALINLKAASENCNSATWTANCCSSSSTAGCCCTLHAAWLWGTSKGLLKTWQQQQQPPNNCCFRSASAASVSQLVSQKSR